MAPSSETSGTPATNGIPSQYNSSGWRLRNDRGYRILEEPHGTRRKLRVVFIGAGASGICFAKLHQDLLKDVDLQIYEKNADVGGTWLENKYPGIACDIPSVNYQFTWERNPHWSQFYSSGQEIWQYMKDIATKYGLDRYIKLQHTVTATKWNSDNGQWHLKIRGPDGEEFSDSAHVLINGSGFLNDWKWPEIKGLHTFEGSLQHTAAYDPNLDLTGKKVAVIGSGSSGVQIIPNIVDRVEHLYTWIRSPTWITPAFAQKFAGRDGKNFDYTEEQKTLFEMDPKLSLKYSKMIESELNQRFKLIVKGTEESKNAKKFAINDMRMKLGNNEELIDAIIPKNFEVGCRRPTPGNGFLESLGNENVTVFTKMMKEITPRGFLDYDGKEYAADAIICATGFNTSWIPRFSVEANGVVLSDLWAEKPTSYLALAVPKIPNYFLMAGPYGPLGHGSFLPVIEIISKNIIQVIEKMQVERIKWLYPRQDVVDQFVEHADLFLTRTAWSGACHSWFKRGRLDGPLAMFPGTRLTYIDLISKPRFEDYVIEHLNNTNMFEFLGSGFDVREFDGRDLSFYLGLLDGEDKQIDLESEVMNEIVAKIPQAVNRG